MPSGTDLKQEVAGLYSYADPLHRLMFVVYIHVHGRGELVKIPGPRDSQGPPRP